MLRLFAETVAKAAFKLALLDDPTIEGSGLVWLHKDGKLVLVPLDKKPNNLQLIKVTKIIWKSSSDSLLLNGLAKADDKIVNFAIIQKES